MNVRDALPTPRGTLMTQLRHPFFPARSPSLPTTTSTERIMWISFIFPNGAKRPSTRPSSTFLGSMPTNNLFSLSVCKSAGRT